jgi:hypothetical protein
VFQVVLAAAQKQFPDAQVCGQPEANNVPGTPSEPGELEVLCFTATSQGGAATPYDRAVFAGLVQGTSGDLLIECNAYNPQSTTKAVIQGTVLPILDSAHWLQLASS